MLWKSSRPVKLLFFFWLKEYVNYLDRFYVMLGSPLLQKEGL